MRAKYKTKTQPFTSTAQVMKSFDFMTRTSIIILKVSYTEMVENWRRSGAY